MALNTTLFHRTQPPRIVQDEATRDALLASGWADTPAAFYAPEPEPCAPAVLCDAVHHTGEPTWRCERLPAHRGPHRFREYPA